MKLSFRLAFALVSVLVITNANATIFDFKAMAEPGGTYGESSWDTLSLTGTGFTLDITGFTTLAGVDDDSNQYAYLDSGGAGLGVCRDLLGAPTNSATHSGTNLCSPSDDDNVTGGEALHFKFSSNVIIDKIWFNNNHDGDQSLLGNSIVIGGSAYTFTNGGYLLDSSTLSPYYVSADSFFDIAFDNGSRINDQFYVSKIDVRSVPEPATLALMGIGLLGLGLSRRKAKP